MASKSYIFATEISNLVIDRELKYEIKVNKTTFIAFRKFKNVYKKRYGNGQSFTTLKKENRYWQTIPDDATIAIVYMKKASNSEYKSYKNRIRHDLFILSASKLGDKRTTFRKPEIKGWDNPGTITFGLIQTNGDFRGDGMNRTDQVYEMDLSYSWYKNTYKQYYEKLISILYSKNVKIDIEWKNRLERATYFAGKSQNTKDIRDAFLFNFIAIESLLKKDGVFEQVPERAGLLFGWLVKADRNIAMEESLRSVSTLRNALVHDANTTNITPEALIFTDTILHNILMNISINIEHFKSQKDLFQYCDKLKALYLLGIENKLQPKNFRFVEMIYYPKDIDTMNETMRML